MKIRKQLPRYKEPDPTPEAETVDLWFTTHLTEEDTGAKPTIYVSPRYQSNHECRVKVSNDLCRITRTNNFSIQLSDLSIIGRCKLPQKHLVRVRRWVDLNREVIQEFWVEGDSTNLIQEMMKI